MNAVNRATRSVTFAECSKSMALATHENTR
jgi:hypothetical protein